MATTTSNNLVKIADRLNKVGEQSIPKKSLEAYENAEQIIEKYEESIGKNKGHTYTMLTSSKLHKVHYNAPKSQTK